MKGHIISHHNPASIPRNKATYTSKLLPYLVLSITLFTWYILHTTTTTNYGYHSRPSQLAKFHKCSIDTYLSTNLTFLSSAEAPPLSEFISRRNALAVALATEDKDAFVAEPGYTFFYYANISQLEWEPWEPEERPFLMVIRPQELSTGEIVANTSFLVPHFEEERAQRLGMAFAEDEIRMITYEEHWDYYTTLYLSDMWGDTLSPQLMVDDEMRDFIARGLASNGFTVSGLAGEVEAVRQVKTAREMSILKAVNTGTVEAIRAMRSCLYHGVTENEVKAVLDDTLRAGGLDPFFDIVEFGKSAALPHGGYDGTRRLAEGMFVLVDVGARLFGYSSDVSRTFYPPFEPEAEASDKTEQMDVWKLVLDAQAAAVKAMVPGATAASVDIAARDVIEAAGYGDYFTHRLGHGIGIKAHESPYLNKGNFVATLRPGMVFTAEPGVYMLDRFGVRHEDVLVIRDEGEAENISGGFAKSPWQP